MRVCSRRRQANFVEIDVQDGPHWKAVSPISVPILLGIDPDMRMDATLYVTDA